MFVVHADLSRRRTAGATDAGGVGITSEHDSHEMEIPLRALLRSRTLPGRIDVKVSGRSRLSI